MSGPSETSKPADKPTTQIKEANPPTKLEEDDEFEDFPSEGMLPISRNWCQVGANKAIDWTEENTDLPSGNSHLWEESWDDDDTSDDFSAQLKEELKKVEAQGKKS